jgi:chemosensory pili system protein ChpA (sensor histidine kinase/response regulator)
VLKVLHISVAGGSYAVPFAAVRHTLSLTDTEIVVDQQGGSVTEGGRRSLPRRHARIDLESALPELPSAQGSARAARLERAQSVPVLSLAELLGYEYLPRDSQPTLLLDLGGRRVALLVDGAFGDHEVVVRALPTHLRRPGIRGATVTLDGQVLLLLDIAEMVSGVLEGRSVPPAPRPAPRLARTPDPLVLVVDDSISIRSALEALLTRAGFEVRLARDGFEALALLKESLPQAMLLDIEMPRLDGFELLAVLRAAPQFAGVRVAVLTSKATDQYRERARTLGADAYLVKPCPDDELLAVVHRLVAETPATA